MENGQQVLFVTERCVIELRPDGLTVVEVAPGIDLQREVLDRAAIPLLVATDLRTMEPALFTDALFGLDLDRSKS
jgi:propionate CoA-transferase